MKPNPKGSSSAPQAAPEPVAGGPQSADRLRRGWTQLDGVAGDVVLRMAFADWQLLLRLLARATGDVHITHGTLAFYRAIALVNRLNAGNPDFLPYEIPPEFAEPCTSDAGTPTAGSPGSSGPKSSPRSKGGAQ